MNGKIDIIESIEYLDNVYYENKYIDRFTSIIILTHNKLDYTKATIESIRKFTKEGTYEIIVVDNNSTDETVEWLQNQDDLKIIYNAINVGFPKGCNQGIEISKGENILLLNNDVIVTPNWLCNLDSALYSSENIGAVGAVSNSCSYYQQIDVGYNNIEDLLVFSEQFNKLDPNKWDLRTKLIGFCILIKKSVIDKVGMLEEIFTPGNYEDDDLSYRIIKNGYKLLLCKDTFIHHFGSVSFREVNTEYTKLLQTNSDKFYKKWGFRSEHNGFIRFEVIDMINEETNKSMNILEVGCGLGATLLEIKNRYKNANTYGIEVCEEVVDIAKNSINICSINIENSELEHEEQYFDYILLCDVLEKLNNPWKVLGNLKKYLKKDGHIIASIPNLMHVSVLNDLMKGSFTYSNAGIFDKTHLRFFTLNEINKMFINNEYEITNLLSTKLYMNDDQIKFIDTMASIYGEHLREQYTSYQYLVKAKKKFDFERYLSEEMINLKYLLMRIDNNIDVESNLVNILSNYEIDNQFIDDVKYLIQTNTINKSTVLNALSVYLFNYNLNEYALNLIILALEIDRDNVDVIFNACNILLSYKEYEIVKNLILNSCDEVKSDEGINNILSSLMEV